MSLLCKLGLHEDCYVKTFDAPAVKGPFDPNQARTVETQEWICATCGRKRLEIPNGYDF